MHGIHLGCTGNQGGHGGDPGGIGRWDGYSFSSSSYGGIKTDFILGSSATNFSGFQKAY